jgi:hypothetical protein
MLTWKKALGYECFAAGRASRGKHHSVVGAQLSLRHERIGDRKDRGQQEADSKYCAYKKYGGAAYQTFVFHPSTSLPNLSSMIKRRAMMITMAIAMSTAAADSF